MMSDAIVSRRSRVFIKEVGCDQPFLFGGPKRLIVHELTVVSINFLSG